MIDGKHFAAGTVNEKYWFDGKHGVVPVDPVEACGFHYPIGTGRACACMGIEAQYSSSDSDDSLQMSNDEVKSPEQKSKFTKKDDNGDDNDEVSVRSD